MKQFYLAITAFIFSIGTATAQSNFKPGYIINNQQDTIKGYLDYREWNKNPNHVSFKTMLDKPAQKINVSNAKGFGVIGTEYYEKAVVSVSSSEVNVARLSFGIDTASTIDTVFLKRVINGAKLNLYELTTAQKTLFYIGDKQTGEVMALKQYIFLGDDNHTIVYSNRYTGLLIVLANKYQPDDKKLQNMIIRADYKTDDLKRIVLKLNGNEATSQLTADNGGLRYFAGAGAANARFVFSGSEAPFSDGKSTTSFAPMLSAGMDYLINKRTERMVFRLEASAFFASYKITERRVLNIVTENTVDRSLEFKQAAFSLVPQVIYNFYSTDRFKIFGDLGLGFNYNLITDQKYRSVGQDGYVRDSNNLDFESFQVVIPLKAGVQIGKNLQIFGGYILPTAITRYLSWSANLSVVTGGVTYLFK